MRDEMIKRLDDLLGRVLSVRADRPKCLSTWHADRFVLRAEIEAERCENCTHRLARTMLGGAHDGLGECAVFETNVYDADYCSNFVVKS